MKRLNYMYAIFAFATLASCSTNETENKTITPIPEKSTVEFADSTWSPNEEQEETVKEPPFEIKNVILPSKLKGKVEVIDVKKYIGNYGYPYMEITFKLLSKVNTTSLCSAGGQMWLVGKGQTEKGVDVKELLPTYREWRSGDSMGNEFKEFLEGDIDGTITLEFSGKTSDNTKSDLEKVKKFKLLITN